MSNLDDLFAQLDEGGTSGSLDDLFAQLDAPVKAPEPKASPMLPKGRMQSVQQQPLESDLARITQPRPVDTLPPVQDRIRRMPPAPAEIRNSPTTIYESDNPVLNAALGIPRATGHAVEQVIQAAAGFAGDQEARKASERRAQGLALASPIPDVEQGAGSMIAISPFALINPALGAVAAGGLSMGPAIGEGAEAGLSTAEQWAYGAGHGGLEYLTERMPLGILFGKGGATVVERLLRAAFPEFTTEQIATLTQDAWQKSVIEPNKPWSEYLAERPEAAKRTALATLGGLGAAGAVMGTAQALERPSAARMLSEGLDQQFLPRLPDNQFGPIVQELYDRGRARFTDEARRVSMDDAKAQYAAEMQAARDRAVAAMSGLDPDNADDMRTQNRAMADYMSDLTEIGRKYASVFGTDAVASNMGAALDATMPGEYAGPQGYAQQEAAPEVESARVAQEDAFDVSGRTDEQLAWLAEHGKPGWKEAAIAEGERRGIAPVEQEAQASQRPPAKPARAARSSDNLLRRINQLGGINMRYLPDVTGESKVRRGMPVGLFRKNGMGLDDLSRMLADEGFPINVEDPTDIDGVRQLTELLQNVLSGGVVLNYWGQQSQIDAMLKAEAEIQANTAQAARDDPEAIAEREAIQQADAAIQDVTDDELDALLDAAFNEERTPNAITSDAEIDQLFPLAQDAQAPQSDGPETGALERSQEEGAFALDAYTPDDLRQREVQPEQAQPEVPGPAGFVLTGSNRQADEAEARGQIALPGAYTVSEPTTDEYTHDLFGNPLPDKPRARGSRAQQQAAQTRNVDTASPVPPGQYGTTTKLITHATREIGATNVTTVEEAATALSYLGRGAVERFDALVTDKNGKPLALVGSFKGALTQASVFPATIIAEAFDIQGAAHIWFAHNHPSGAPELSQADRWLTSKLEEVFDGTGIKTHGLLAITNDGRYSHTDEGRGTIKPAKDTMRLDAVEREFDRFDKLGGAFSSPAAAQAEVRTMGIRDPGLILLDTQNAPIAFLPMTGEEAMPLKDNGRLDALYRAISYANAGGVIIYDPRGDFSEQQYKNLGAALGQMDVKLLDVLQKGVSLAEKGKSFVASVLYTRGITGKGMTVEAAAAHLRKRFGKRIDRMQEAGTLKIVATPAQLPAWGKGQRGIGGAWDGTTAWIVASQASPETLAATYLHEVGEHAGMQEMLGDKYQDVITRLDDLIWDGDATANRAASRVPKDTPAKDEQHERLAYFIEEAQRARDAKPQTLSTKARQLLQDIIAAIRAWAYSKFGGITLTEADILALARQSAKRVADQASEKLDAMREAEVQFSKEPQSTDAEELARKFGFAVKGQAEAAVQTVTEQAMLDAQALFEQAKGGVISHDTMQSEAERLGDLLGWSVESMQEVLQSKTPEGFRPVDVLGAAIATARMHTAGLLTAQTPDQFVGIVADVVNLMIATRANVSEAARSLGHYGWLQRQGGYVPQQKAKGAENLPGPGVGSQQAQKTQPGASQQAKQAKTDAAKAVKDVKVQDSVVTKATPEQMTQALGGEKGIKKLMDFMKERSKDIDLNQLVRYLSSMGDAWVEQMKRDADRGRITKFMDAWMELFQANILTGLFTHQINVTSNVANLLLELGWDQVIKAGLGGKAGVRGLAAGYRELGEVRKLVADIYAMMKYNAFEEMPAHRLTLLLAQKDPTLLALMQGDEIKWRDSKSKHLPGMFGKVVRTYGYVPLGIEDAIFKVILYKFELARQRGAGEAQDITKAIEFAKEGTFQSDFPMPDWLHHWAAKGAGILFMKTMTNMIRRTLQHIPVAGQIVERKALAGKRGEDAQRAAIARGISGVLISALLWGAIGDDDDDEAPITGYAPFERRERALWMMDRDQVALRIGDTLYPLYRLDPAAGIIGLNVAAKHAANAGDADQAAKVLANGLYQSVVSKHFMQTFVDLVEGLMWMAKYKVPQEEAKDELVYQAPGATERVARGVGKHILSTLIPNMVPQIGDMTDEYKRKTRNIEDDLKRKFPMLREELPELLDASGHPVGEPRFHSPFPVNSKPAKRDEVARWQMKLDKILEPDPISIRKLPPEERKELLQRRWDLITLAYEVSHELPVEFQRKVLDKAKDAWSKHVRGTILMHRAELLSDKEAAAASLADQDEED